MSEANRNPAVRPNPVDAMSQRSRIALFAVMALGQVIALMDIQIVAGALGPIQAGLSAGPDEIAWVQTSYLMAEIVMVPLAAFLARALSTQWLFTGSAALFTLSSLMCGLAWDLDSMILFRTIQGFVGGAMVPTCFAITYSLFDGKLRATMAAVLGMLSTLGPMVGPSLGGFIAEISNWRWLFFINVAPGVLIVILMPILGKVDYADTRLLKRIDWMQVVALAVFLGGLQFVLEEGPRHEWFGDVKVASAAWFSFVAAILFFERCFYSKNPVVQLRPFKNRSFGLACLMNLLIGVGLYATVYLTPVFLDMVRDYNSLQIGAVVVVSGVFMAVGAPISVRLLAAFDGRVVMALGLTLYAVFLFMCANVSSSWSFGEFLIPQIIRGLAILMCIMPAISMALNGQREEDMHAASGLFNLMRNLGGAIGIAIVNTQLMEYSRLHAQRLSEGLTNVPGRVDEALRGLTVYAGQATPDPAHAHDLAVGALASIIKREAATLAFADIFQVMAWGCLATLLIVPFCKIPPMEASSPAAH